MKKTNIFILIGAVIVLATFGWLVLSNKVFEQPSATTNENYQPEVKQEVSLIINSGEGSPDTFQIELTEGMTAFDLLKEETEKHNIILQIQDYEDMGIFIEAIGDKENGEDGKYWLYYLNGEMSPLAADKQQIKVGDIVEFKFENSPF